MFPQNVTRHDILKAIEEIDNPGIPANRYSTSGPFCVSIHYPPNI